MKAVAVNQFKSIPQVMDLPEPPVKAGTIRIRLAAAGLNPFDWKLVDGILENQMPHVFPMILGTDGAGVVESVGAGVDRFKVGDRVYGQMIHPPVGEGSYAEMVTVPDSVAIAAAPHSIALSDAAALPTAGMTALQLLDRSGLTEGQKLLLIGATGGVGSFLTQVAKARGIYVIATASSEESAARTQQLGAAETINYKTAPVEEQFPGGADALIDLVSDKVNFEKMLPLVKKGGHVNTTQFVADKDRIHELGLRGGNFETKGTPASLDALRELIDNGRLTVPVDRRIPLDQAPQAIADSRAAKSKGKTILLIDTSLD
ncbi:NADP-dependent oxidoreductase [Chitinophaga sp. NPDC101104]|uniref:NADP-dependent oxidoreductase n=1 Tax=Chitinophaga sp. NPDC101104 TaxID=3390561 RepID=UPI003D07C16B